MYLKKAYYVYETLFRIRFRLVLFSEPGTYIYPRK